MFPLCSPKEQIHGTQKRPCLQYFIHRCLGACAGKADPDEYKAAVHEVLLFLDGKHEQLLGKMRKQMEAASENLRFEEAAYLRDRLNELAGRDARQKVVMPQAVDMDVVALALEHDEACAELLFVRNGKLSGHEHFVMKNAEGESAPVIEQTFMELYYSTAATIPKLLVVQHALPNPEPLRAMLELKRTASVEIHVPKRGEKKALIDMAAKNAKEGLAQERFKWLSDEQKRTGALSELQQALDLPGKPQRIECFDISNAQGTNTVGSMVVFENGSPARSEYRRFQVKTVDGPNDFESMREVLTRRFKRAASTNDEDAKWTRLPDLLIVDGGKGQLGVAMEVLAAAGMSDLPVAGLAKQMEEIFRPGRRDSLLLPRNSEALYLIQRIRDEAHRFAITYHRDLRSKKSIKSPLDDVQGIGPKRKKALIKTFGSVAGIRAASVDDVAAVQGIDRATAERVKERI
jgi:excinuclease ABC subunit C